MEATNETTLDSLKKMLMVRRATRYVQKNILIFYLNDEKVI